MFIAVVSAAVHAVVCCMARSEHDMLAPMQQQVVGSLTLEVPPVHERLAGTPGQRPLAIMLIMMG